MSIFLTGKVGGWQNFNEFCTTTVRRHEGCSQWTVHREITRGRHLYKLLLVSQIGVDGANLTENERLYIYPFLFYRFICFMINLVKTDTNNWRLI